MKKVGLIIISVCLFICCLYSVKADDIKYKRLEGIYFNLTVDGKFESNHVTMFYLGNRLAYCIEPGKDINTKSYDSYKGWDVTSLSKEKQAYIERLGYYGYEYPGHQTDKYYIATQELIWKAVKNVTINWTTEKDNGGQAIDIEKEKTEILRLVNEDAKKPSFINQIITGKVSETVEYEDNNHVLENYSLSKSHYHNAKIIDNTLQVTFNKDEKEPEELTLTKKHYDNQTLLIYTKGDSQKLAALRLTTPDEVTIKLQNYKEPEEIVKVPNTADDYTIKRFGVAWSYNSDRRFN